MSRGTTILIVIVALAAVGTVLAVWRPTPHRRRSRRATRVSWRRLH